MIFGNLPFRAVKPFDIHTWVSGELDHSAGNERSAPARRLFQHEVHHRLARRPAFGGAADAAQFLAAAGGSHVAFPHGVHVHAIGRFVEVEFAAGHIA
ncbi:hypothetical protein D9M69_668350 [compost metagenome]